MIKELLDVEREWDRIYGEFVKKRTAVIARVLPVGRKVSWTHATNKIVGTVVELPRYDGDYVLVRNDGSGKTRQVKADQLTLE